MKLLVTLFVYYLITSPTGCSDKKIQPYFPSDVTSAQKKNLLNQYEKGELLFKNNCSKCHGIFTKGRDSIPNFSKVQMDNYATRFLVRDAKNHAVIQQLSQQDFTSIMIFLTYLQKKDSASANNLPKRIAK